MAGSVDIAELGLVVRSDGVVVASQSLRELTREAGKAETAEKGLTASSERASKAHDRLAESAQRYGRILGRVVRYGTIAMTGLAANSVRLAVAAEEMASKFQVVFRGSVEAANARLVEMSKTIPLTVTEMRKFAAGIQDMLVPMGLARKEAAEFSITTLQLAADIGSFNDVDTAVVLRDIQSALAGQIEPLRKYGVFLTQDRLKAIALQEGLVGLGDEMTTVAKAQATFIAITRDSSDAMGDAARTADSVANQSRRAARDFKQAQEDLGQLLIPAYGQLLQAINQVNDNGLTPLQRGMGAISIAILGTVKYILMLVAGFTQLGGVIDKIELRFVALKNSVAIVINDIVEGINALARIPSLTLGIITPDLLPTQQFSQAELEARAEAVRAAAEAVRQSGLATEEELNDLFATIAGIDAAIVALGQGVDRSLADVRAGMGEIGDAASDAVAGLTEDDAEAFAKLRNELDPLGAEMEYVAGAQSLLEKALKAGAKNGGIGISTYAKLARALYESTTAFQRATEAALRFAEVDFMTQVNLDASIGYVESLEAIEEQVKALDESLNPAQAEMQRLADAYKLLDEAFAKGVIDEAEFWRLSEALDGAVNSVELLNNAFYRGAQEWLNTLQGLQNLFHEDSKAADALRTAMIALNIVMGVQAVLKQLSDGPWYDAIPRALTVAGLVASLGVDTGASGGGGAKSRSLQESQGTGSVLGDAEKKTESIVRATEITADATSELVGINRGMLHALQALQSGITNAVVRLARGGEGDFGDLPEVFSFGDTLGKIPLLGGIGEWFGGVLDNLFGGSADLVDQGIRIMGGTLNELTAEVFAEAFRYVNVKKHIFDDTDLERQFQTLGDDVTEQFALIFGSIRDTVTEAAIALGIPLDEIEARIASFEVAAIEISFKDLTAAEQREELLAVFGEIFDDLARHVIPFVDQFQKVGEGLGETLVRVATSVQVFQEAIGALGLVVNQTDPELFAQMAVGLVELTGGVENFIAQFTTFFDRFASDEQKLAFVTSQLTRGFEAVGLVVPATRDGMIDLMMSLDATTDAGRRQIATVLELAGVADEYYSLQEAASEDRLEAAEAEAAIAAKLLSQVQTVADFVGVGPPSQLLDLRNRFEEAMLAADALNASQREYAMITRAFNLQLKRMAAELTISILSMAKRLFGSESQDTGDEIADGLEEVRLVSNSLFQDWLRALEDIKEYTDSLLLDEALTTLTPAEQFAESQRQFNRMLAAARAGDVEAAAALPDAAQALLEEARFMFASGAQYQKVFDATIAALESIKMPSGIPEFIEEATGGTQETDPRTEQEKAWDVMTEKFERFLLALDLAGALRDLSQVLGTSVLDLVEEFGIPLRELVSILGVELDTLNETTAEGLAEIAQLLGSDIYALLDALDVDLRELAEASGVVLTGATRELAAQLGKFAKDLGVDVLDLATRLEISLGSLAKTFGISIEEFKASQFTALIEFADALGAPITEVTKALGLNLGKITDATSLLSQSFSLAMDKLPAAIQKDLGPLLVAIREATTASDSRAAINALGNYILGLPPDIAASLRPYLELIGWQQVSPDLAALGSIDANTAETVNAVNRVASAVGGLSVGNYVSPYSGYNPVTGEAEAYETREVYDASLGTMKRQRWINGRWEDFHKGGHVERTELAMVHAGEFVVNPQRNNLTVQAPENSLTTSELSQIRSVLQDIREQNRKYQQEDLAATKGIESSMKQQAEQQRRRANG